MHTTILKGIGKVECYYFIYFCTCVVLDESGSLCYLSLACQ